MEYFGKTAVFSGGYGRIGEIPHGQIWPDWGLDWKGIFRVSESTSTVESEFMGGSAWPKGFTKFLKEKANLFSHKGTGVKDVEKEYEQLVESDIFFR